MRSVFKAVAATAVLVPVMLAGATVASADEGPAYKQKTNSATAAGGASAKVASGFWGDTAYFFKQNAVATPAGATGTSTGSRS